MNIKRNQRVKVIIYAKADVRYTDAGEYLEMEIQDIENIDEVLEIEGKKEGAI